MGRELGLVDDSRWRAFDARREWLAAEATRLHGIFMRPVDVPAGETFEPLAREVSAYGLLRRPGIGYADVAALPRVGRSSALDTLDAEAVEQWTGSLTIDAHYAGYVERQGTEIERQRRQSDTRLPDDLDYTSVNGLSNELREKLTRIRPNDIGQAARISGMTPAAISLLLIHVKKSRRRSA
jgi:tRNA uridine 5-carboxymethylaminomethyl modification enzyme